MDSRLLGSSVHGILQARILEWVATILQGIFLTQGLNPHLLQLLHCRHILYCWATREAPHTCIHRHHISPRRAWLYFFQFVLSPTIKKKKEDVLYSNAQILAVMWFTTSWRKLASTGSLLNRKGFSLNLSQQLADHLYRKPVDFKISIGSGVRQTWALAPPIRCSHL